MKKHLKKKAKGKTITKKKPKTTLATMKKLRVLEFLLIFQIRITRQTLDSRYESLMTK